ncbi:dynamin family protein [Citrobacter sp. S2-9]|uniref:Dynamin family protein n=1 Tax=Citrobacter enshiensis TaxID=2971264 RepID=A0ABT8PNZ9_9ENTR|nr:dynamin family protein [Citrobacter enshiensis]MDN8597920.1 dynamin family protein [Citrobacter enshiensis]
MSDALTGPLTRLIGISKDFEATAPHILNDFTSQLFQINNFTACVPLIGIFSAGKSSLLNLWLGQNILPVDQAPTTALATELHYGEQQALVITLTDGTVREVHYAPQNALDVNNDATPEDQYACLTIPSTRLRDLHGLIPVDMPGVDSGIKRHVDAFYRYAERGAAFIVVVSAESGTLHASLAAVLHEIAFQPVPLLLVLTKCDKLTPESLDNVEEEISGRLSDLGCQPQIVVRASRNDRETADRLQDALLQLNIQDLKVIHFAGQIQSSASRLLDHITMLRKSSTLDPGTLDAQIYQYDRACQELNDTLARQKRRLSGTLRQNTMDKVSGDVHNALVKNLDVLYNCLMQGEDIFQTRTAAIISDVYRTSLNQALRVNLSDIVVNMQNEAVGENIDIGSILQNGSQTAVLVLETLATVSKGSRWYKLISTALAVTTSVINPIVELLIIFLPDIIKLFSDPQERKRELVKQNLQEKVFPEIRQRAREALAEILPEIELELIAGLEEEWRTRIEESRSALEHCREEKRQHEAEWLAQQDLWSAQINEVRDAIREIEQRQKSLAVHP